MAKLVSRWRDILWQALSREPGKGPRNGRRSFLSSGYAKLIVRIPRCATAYALKPLSKQAFTLMILLL